MPAGQAASVAVPSWCDPADGEGAAAGFRVDPEGAAAEGRPDPDAADDPVPVGAAPEPTGGVPAPRAGTVKSGDSPNRKNPVTTARAQRMVA